MSEDYEVLAALLEYPDDDWTERIAKAGAKPSLREFVAGIKSLSDLQELYTRTFDLNPVCALEIGYHLFGESYKRGEFLANLREMEAPFDLRQAQQLPDYLPVLLRLLPKVNDQDLRASLVSECLLPGIEKMLGALKERENPYLHLLETLLEELRTEAGVDSTALAARASLPVLSMTAIDAPGEFLLRE